MIRIGFAGFGEVNTPIEVIERKCKAACESLKTPETEVFPFYPIRDDYEETYINNAIEYFSEKDFDTLVLCVAGWIPTHAIIKSPFGRQPIHNITLLIGLSRVFK